MIRKIIIPVFVLLCFSLSGCKNFLPRGIEIEKYDAIQAIGFDVSEEDPTKIEVTFITKVDKPSDSGSSVNIKTVSESGTTVFETQRKLRAKEEKIAFLGYVDFVLIGEQAAREDFTKYFDFFVRDHETRLSSKVFIVKGCSAKELMTKTSTTKLFIADRLNNIIKGSDILGNSDKVTIIDAMGMLDNKNVAAILPAVKCEMPKNQKRTGEMPEEVITPAGFAIIKDFKLSGYFDENYALGYNLITNNVSSFPISVKDNSGKYVGLELISAKTEVEAKFNGDKLENVTYKTSFTSNVPEQQSRINLFANDGVDDLCSKQSEHVKSLMEDVIAKSKAYKKDCLGLAGKIQMRYPYKWEKIKDQWNEIFPELAINVVVESNIARTYEINLPNGYQGEN